MRYVPCPSPVIEAGLLRLMRWVITRPGWCVMDQRPLLPLVGTFLLAAATCSGSATALCGVWIGFYVLMTFASLLAVFVFSSLVTWALLWLRQP